MADDGLQQDFFEVFLAKFAERFATPSDELPTVRCVSRTTLVRLLGKIRDSAVVEAEFNAPRTPAAELLVRLEHSNLVRRIPLEDPRTGEPLDKLYAVGLPASEIELNPVELMVGFKPKAVVCYFSALRLHSLTTQVPSHYHYAIVSEEATPPKVVPPSVRPAEPAQRTFDPLGTLQFTYQGLCYYETHRDKRLVPGVQARHLHDKTVIRITTREQTLIDTLHRPLSCGGPPVVFEAWEKALDDLSENRMAKYLEAIEDPRVVRRVGFMLGNFGYSPRGKLASLLNAARPDEASGREADAIIPLLPGVNYPSVDAQWQVRVP